ncbi:MAG: hypothetical protein NVS1B11_33020 [Terriglobales bacterium]
MHRPSFLFALIFFAATAFALSPSDAQAQAHPKTFTPLEQVLVDNSKAIPEAVKTKNVDLLKRTLAEDFSVVGSEGGLHDRDELLELASAGALKDYSVYNAKVIPVNEQTAIVTYNFIVNMPEGDTDSAPRYQRVSDLWVKNGNQWQLKFQQATPLRSID